MPAYALNSTRLGSTMIRRTCSGVERMMIDMSIELMKLDFPEPVAPATSRCGILVRSAVTKWPSTSLPTPASMGFGSFIALSERSTSPRWTISRSSFGISMPIADFPGIGERMRTSELATA